jgi:hypothetical protein
MSQESSWKDARGDCIVDTSREPNPHVVIVGMSGMGKSSLFRSVLKDLGRRGANVIIFDAHNEHSGVVRRLGGEVYDARYSGINIFELDGLTVGERCYELAGLLAGVYSLGHVQLSKLNNCLWYTYRKCGARSRNDRALPKVPVMKDLMGELGVFIANARTAEDRERTVNIRSRLESLDGGGLSRTTLSLQDLRSGVHSFSIRDLKSNGARQVYLHEVLRRLYLSMKESMEEKGIATYVMIDEAQSLITESEGESPIAKILEEGRKFGFGSIVATQMATSLDRRIIANSATFISFHAKEPREINYVTNVLSGSIPKRSDSVRTGLNGLKQNEAIVVRSATKGIFIVETPKADPADSAEDAGEKKVEKEELLGYFERPARLEDVAKTREVQLYALDDLVAGGKLERFAWEEQGSAEVWFMRRRPGLSIAHEVHVEKIAAELSAGGFDHAILGGASRPDLWARISGKRIAIEYETGRKSVEESAKMFISRFTRYDIVVAVVKDEAMAGYTAAISDPRVIIVTYRDFKRFLKAGTLVGQ